MVTVISSPSFTLSRSLSFSINKSPLLIEFLKKIRAKDFAITLDAKRFNYLWRLFP